MSQSNDAPRKSLLWSSEAHTRAKTESIVNRRRFERFDLELPAEIEVLTPEHEKHTYDLLTRDVSAGGAFFPTAKAIPAGARVRLNLVISRQWLERLTGTRGLIEVGGTVVRSDPQGIAISFDKDYRFTRIGPLHS